MGLLTRREVVRLGTATALAAAPVALSARMSGVNFSFVQLTDSHLSRGRIFSKRKDYDVSSKESIRHNRAAVKEINRCVLPYELVIHTGDLADRPEPEDLDLAQEVLQFRQPALFIPGNHDVGYSDMHRTLPPFEKRFGKTNRVVEPTAGLRLVFLNSQPLDPRANVEAREETFRDLERMLARPMPTIVLCHCMGLESFYNNQMDAGWPAKTMLRWTEQMKRGGVEAVMAGHFHRDETHVVNGIPFYLAGPVIHYWGRQTSFRHWAIQNGALTHRTVYVDI